MSRPSRLRIGSLSRNIALLATGTLTGQGLVILVSPIVTRLYGPEDLGLLAVFAAIVSSSITVVALRYEQAIPLPSEDMKAVHLVILSLLMTAVISVTIGVLAWVTTDLIDFAFGAPRLSEYVWLLPVSVFGGGVYVTLVAWSTRRTSYAAIAKTRLTQGLATAISQVGLGLLGMVPTGLLLSDALGRAAGSGSLVARILAKDGHLFRSTSFREVRAVAVEFRHFVFLAAPSGLLNTLALTLPVLVLSTFFGAQVAGWLALSQRVVGAPSILIGSAVSQVYFGRAAAMVREGEGNLRQLYAAFAVRLFLVGLVPTIILVLAAPSLFAAVFGPDWQEAGIYAQLLAPMYLSQFVVFPLAQTLNVTRHLGVQLGWNSIRAVIVVTALFLTRGETPIVAISLYSASMTAGYLLNLGLCLHFLRIFDDNTSPRRNGSLES